MNTTMLSQQLAYLGKGSVDAEATEIVAEVVKAVRETRKKGQVTVTLDFSMLDRASEDAMMINATIKCKKPQLPAPSTVMFSTYDGDLLRDDPDQRTLDLRQVEAQQQTEFRRAPAGNRTIKTVGTNALAHDPQEQEQ